jgi:hypothetical protein
MVYTGGMPEVSSSLRLARMPTLSSHAIRVPASDAVAAADLGNRPGPVILTTSAGRPAYRIGPRPVTIFADSGERLETIDESQTVAIARQFVGASTANFRYERLVTTPDQWTLTQRRHLPLHKIQMDDSMGTELYISSRLGEVVVQTTRRTRALAWVSAIPHWLYFTSLRTNDWLWRQLVLWLAALATLGATLGLLLAFVQFSVRYRGWLRWHYRAGVAFGMFVVTWSFSGLLSMEPWFWARDRASNPIEGVTRALEREGLDFSAFPEIGGSRWTEILDGKDVKEVEFLLIQGEPHLALKSSDRDVRLLHVGARLEARGALPADSLVALVRRSTTGAAIVESRLLDRYDAYYHARTPLPLPVLQLKFDDPDRTWLYIDPLTSRIVARFNRRSRVQRWLYNGLHSLDFPFLYQRRPLWDIVVVTLCLGGAALSFIGVVLAARRVSGVLRRR